MKSSEYSIAELHHAFQQHHFSVKECCQYYLERIAKVDQQGPCLRAVVEINPDALTIAETIDHELTRASCSQALQGIPILLKDSIDTGDHLATTGGSLALLGN